MRIMVKEIMGGEETLFGVPLGRACLSKLLTGIQEPPKPSVLFLDFDGIASATVSFLREGPLAYRDFLRAGVSMIYPVFANLAPPVADSMGEFLSYRKDAVFACELSKNGEPSRVRLLGDLEPKQSLTFNAILEMGEVTASELAEKGIDPEKVGVTAWNNRLAALASKGLLLESRSGRSKTFKLLLEEDK